MGKDGIAANAGGCLYVQHLINSKEVSIYLHITMVIAANYKNAVFLQVR